MPWVEIKRGAGGRTLEVSDLSTPEVPEGRYVYSEDYHRNLRTLGKVADWVDLYRSELLHLKATLKDDRFLDAVLDELTERAGHPRNTDALGLARWDLKAAIQKALEQMEDRSALSGRQEARSEDDECPGDR